MESIRQSSAPYLYDPNELESLPPPVQRYFRVALRPGQPIIQSVWLDQEGWFNGSETREAWHPFTATQRVLPRQSAFDWNARIRIFPGLDIRVHDAYFRNEGYLHAAVCGALTVAKSSGSPEATQGEFMRFAAEAPWYPTSMLPSQGAVWSEVNEKSATLKLRDQTIQTTLLMHFGSDHLIQSFEAAARQRGTTGKSKEAPWQGRFWDYVSRSGMMVPRQGEVEWVLADGPRPYWRGRVTSFRYEFS